VKRSRFVPLLLTALLLPCAARARLGETEGHCGRRYGTALRVEMPKPGRLVKTYEKSGYRVRVEFTRAQRWLFFHPFVARVIAYRSAARHTAADEHATGSTAELDDTSLARFLAANADKREWKEANPAFDAARTANSSESVAILSEADACRVWRRDDGAVARYDRRTGELTIRAEDAKAGRPGGERDAPSAESLEGF
jgi:hypothetical protein